jgi:hypothetical protein
MERVDRFTGLVEGKNFRKPWFSPSKKGFPVIFSLKPI